MDKKGDIVKINLSSVIYGAYVKQELLRNLVYETYGNSSIETATKLNIFIDLNSVLHALYSENNRIIFDNITDISSGIVNMCAHYRSFFRSQLGVDTRFFLINSLNICDINRKFVSEYNSKFMNKTNISQTVNIINNNMSLLKILCPYLPAIYYVDSPQNFEVSVIIGYIIESLNDPNPNLVISKDPYALQLVTNYKWTSYLAPIKSYGNDNSWMLPINEKEGFREQFWMRVSEIRKCSYNILKEISPINYSLFTAMTKVPERGMLSVVSSPAAKNFIKHIVGSEDVKIQSNQFLNDPELVSKYPVSIIDARYKAIDINYMLPYYRNTPEAKQMKFIDLDDAPTVNKIASKYYAYNPLELQKL